MVQSQFDLLLIGVGGGIGVALLLILCVYYIKNRLITRKIINTPTKYRITTKEEYNMYLAHMSKIRKKRYSRTNRIKKELAAVPKMKNPLVYNTREVELATPGPATKSATPVNTST